jgi:hypothetical protein
MTKTKFSLVWFRDERIVQIIKKTDKKILAIWATDCAKRVLPYFEKKFPNDFRPRHALETLKVWIDTGIFKMAVIRKASLDSHAAARSVGEDNPARSAARACGQAVATAHVKTHSIGSAIYALQAIYRANCSNEAASEVLINKEKEWQYKHLLELRKK